jgi:pSer/pThr/pTyr-binding forkhead associated (FHA) protein
VPDVVTDDMPYLETLDRTDEQLEYVLSRNRVVLGTAAGSDVVIGEAFQGHETVSPRHAELRKEGDSFMLVDLDSEHGTFVNDVRTGENLLSDGDVVSLGSVRFVFRVPQA